MFFHFRKKKRERKGENKSKANKKTTNNIKQKPDYITISTFFIFCF